MAEEGNTNPTSAEPSSSNIGQQIKNLQLHQILTTLTTLWKNQKILSSIVLVLLGILGFGGYSYSKLKNDAAAFHEIYPQYEKLRAEERVWGKTRAELDRSIYLLQNKEINFDSIVILLSEIEIHLAAASYAIASLIFSSVDIHDSQIIRHDDKLAWTALGEFSDFLIKLERLLKRVAPSKEKAQDVSIIEAASYAALRGKYYEALQYKDVLRGEIARKTWAEYIKHYLARFPDNQHHGHFMMGLYYTLLPVKNLEQAMNSFNNSITSTPSGDFWIDPYYQKISIYELKNDLDMFLKQCFELKSLFEVQFRKRRHQLYILTLMSLIEGQIAKYNIPSEHVNKTFAELNKTWNMVKDDVKFFALKDHMAEINVLEKLVNDLVIFQSGAAINYDDILNSDAYKVKKEVYYSIVINKIKDYINAERMIDNDNDKDKIHAEALLAKLAEDDEELTEAIGPKFLLFWIKEKAKNRSAVKFSKE